MPDIDVALGQIVRAHRNRAGISQEELAARAGIHRTYISAVELGKVRLGIGAAKRLADGLRVPLSHLIAEAESTAAEKSDEGNG